MDHTYYPVRCCCQPRKVFGFLRLPKGLGNDSRFTVMEQGLVSRVDPETLSLMRGVRTHTIRLREFHDYDRGLHEIAVYSDDHPIEFWRRILGFHEAANGVP